MCGMLSNSDAEDRSHDQYRQKCSSGIRHGELYDPKVSLAPVLRVRF